MKTLAAWVSMIDTSDPTKCWPWPGPVAKKGYGQADGPAHRAVYELMVGPIPAGHQIDHACHNDSDCNGGDSCTHRLCVNWVRHLQPVTCRINLLRSKNTLNSINVAKTQCPKGHPYDEENTTYRNGRRYCRECTRLRAARNYHANIEANRIKARDRARRRRAA